MSVQPGLCLDCLFSHAEGSFSLLQTHHILINIDIREKKDAESGTNTTGGIIFSSFSVYISLKNC